MAIHCADASLREVGAGRGSKLIDDRLARPKHNHPGYEQAQRENLVVVTLIWR